MPTPANVATNAGSQYETSTFRSGRSEASVRQRISFRSDSSAAQRAFRPGAARSLTLHGGDRRDYRNPAHPPSLGKSAAVVPFPAG